MANKYRSFTIRKGVASSPNRSMLRAIGYQDADFDKPIVGIASGLPTMTRCNAGIQPLADAPDAAARKAGAMPQMFGTITVTDGISMGTEGMKYSLVSREVIADAIETAAQSQFMDGVLAIGGCDKNLPGAMIGIMRMNVPAICVYGGTIKPGKYQGEDLQIVSVFESVGAFSSGKMSREDFECIERKALPGVGACGGMYTANTMSSSVEAVGMSLPFSSTMAAEDEEKRESAATSMEVLVAAVKKNLKPSDIVTKKSIENAVAVIMATGGSTHGRLHWLPLAHPARDPPARARGRVRDRLPRRDPRRPHQARRRPRDPLRGPEGWPRHARDARAHVGPDRQGSGRLRGPHHRRALLRRHVGHGGGARHSGGLRRRRDRAGERGRLDHHRRAPPADPAERRRRRDREAPLGVAATEAEVHHRRARQVREAGGHGGQGRGDRLKGKRATAVLFVQSA